MNLFDALYELKAKSQVVFNYLDRHDTAADLQALNDEYTPQALKDEVNSVLVMADRIVEALSNAPEDTKNTKV